MKKRIKIQSAMAVTMILFTAQVYSQTMYINVGVGYGLPAATNLYKATEYSSVSNGSSTTSNNKQIKGTGSFGKGIQAGGTFGYMFNENIGAELGLSYLVGAKETSKNSNTGNSGSYNDEVTLSGRMFRLIPALKITAGKEKAKPYIKAGLVIGVGTKLKISENVIETFMGTSFKTEIESEYSGRVSIGFALGLGVDFKVNDKISFFTEAGVITQSWAPKKAEITKYSENGADQLFDMTTNEKETEFVDSYSESNSNINTSFPEKALKIYLPFSSAGINVGMHFIFGVKQEKK